MIDLQQEIRLRIPACHISDMHLSAPDWSPNKIENTYGLLRDYPRAKELKDRMESKPLHCGFDDLVIALDEGQGYLCQPVRAYDVSYRRTYQKHIEACVSHRNAESILAIGNGNLISNLGILGWVNQNGKHKLLKSTWEEKRIRAGWPYTCLYYDRNQRQAGIDRFTFRSGQPEPLHNLAWLTSGQPILWDGCAPDTEDLIAETYDIRHIYILRTTSGSNEERKQAQYKIQEYMKAWMEVFVSESLSFASERLRSVARRPEFEFDALRDIEEQEALYIDREQCPFIEKRYLQSAVGVNNAGDIFIVQKHGSMKELGLTLNDMGANRGILLDQGGSVGTLYANQKTGMASEMNVRFILQSRDFRPSRLCVLIFELNTDFWHDA